MAAPCLWELRQQAVPAALPSSFLGHVHSMRRIPDWLTASALLAPACQVLVPHEPPKPLMWACKPFPCNPWAACSATA